MVAITNVEGKRLYDATHNDAKGTGTSLETPSRRKAAWFAMKGTLEGLPKARKYPRAPVGSPRELRALELATATLGSVEKAREWLTRPNRGFGGVTPLALLETDAGARDVENVLARIEHGIPG